MFKNWKNQNRSVVCGCKRFWKSTHVCEHVLAAEAIESDWKAMLQNGITDATSMTPIQNRTPLQEQAQIVHDICEVPWVVYGKKILHNREEYEISRSVKKSEEESPEWIVVRSVLNQSSPQDPPTYERLALTATQITAGLAMYNGTQRVGAPSASSGSSPSRSPSSASTSPSPSSVSSQNDLMITTRTDFVVFERGSEVFVRDFRDNARYMDTRALTDIANRWHQEHPDVARTVRGRDIIRSIRPIRSRNTSPPAAIQPQPSAPRVARQTSAFVAPPVASQTSASATNVQDSKESDEEFDEEFDQESTMTVDMDTSIRPMVTPSATMQSTNSRLSPRFTASLLAKLQKLSEDVPYFHLLELYEAYVLFSNRVHPNQRNFIHLSEDQYAQFKTLLTKSKPIIAMNRTSGTSMQYTDHRFKGFTNTEVFSKNRFKSIDRTSRGTCSCMYESVHHAMNGQPCNGQQTYRRDFCNFIEQIAHGGTALASQVLGQNETDVFSHADSHVLEEMFNTSMGQAWDSDDGDICDKKDTVLRCYVQHSMNSRAYGDTFGLHYLARRFVLLIRVLANDVTDNTKYRLLQDVCGSSNPQDCVVLYLLHTTTKNSNGRTRKHFNCLVPILRNIGTHTSDTRAFQTINDGERNMRRRL